MSKNLILIGPMGAGKSSIGKRLAKQLKRSFFDCDRVLEERTGVAITTIFELEGEGGFRQRETKILEELMQHDNVVIATGGGAVLRPENQKLLCLNSVIIFLQASVETQIKRTRQDKKRPLLQTEDRHATLQALAKSRNPIYDDLANITVNTDKQNISSSVETIISKLNNL